MDTKYQDFDVSLDSSLCLPFTGAELNRPPIPFPPRTKLKHVTFASPLEEVLQERPGTYEAPGGVTTTTEPDELEYPELAPGLERGNGSIHGSSCPAVKPLALLSAPRVLCQSPKYPTEIPPSIAARSRHRARDTSMPSLIAESTGRGNHLNSIMAVGPLHVFLTRIQRPFTGAG